MSDAKVMVIARDQRSSERTGIEEELTDLYCAGRWDAFLERVNAEGRNIVLAGGSKAARTTRLDALGDTPASERIVSVEDVGEFFI